MAGKDDLRLLSSFIYTKVKGKKPMDEEATAIGHVAMNRATALGSLPEAINTMNPTPDMIEIMQGNIQGRDEREYKRVIQMTSKLLRGSSDPTGGAVDFAPRNARMNRNGLIKTHGTKHHNFYRPAPSGMQGMRETAL